MSTRKPRIQVAYRVQTSKEVLNDERYDDATNVAINCEVDYAVLLPKTQHLAAIHHEKDKDLGRRSIRPGLQHGRTESGRPESCPSDW